MSTLQQQQQHGAEEARPRVYRCLTIAGSDSGGGAGIQADIKTFAARGVFGMSAITAITAQNTTGVSGVLPIPPETIQAQIEAVLSDLGADAIKIGMLGSKESIEAVLGSLARFYPPAPLSADDADASSAPQPRRELPPIVLDSVMVAKGGQPLLDESAIAHLPAILRYARLVTPNIPEAILLLEHLAPSAPKKEKRVATTVQHVREVAAELAECLRVHHQYTGAVLVKGGHLEEERRKRHVSDDGEPGEEDAVVVDVLCDGEGRLFEYASARVHTRSTHGTGCTLSSAIAAELARGRDLEAAVRKAVRYVHGAILHAPAPDDATATTPLPALPSPYALGSGHGPLDHMWKLKPLLRSATGAAGPVAPGSSRDFGAELWTSIEGVFEKIIAHPFIQGLTSGELPEDVFKFYIVQDMHYLREYSRILALLAAKADCNAGMLLFLESAKSIVGGECAMHLQFCREWGMMAEADDAAAGLASLLEAHPASPTNMLYTSYMLRIGFDRPYYEGVAAVLPCAWIYNEVGHYLKSKGSPHPQYARWIETYGSEEFSATTKSLIEITTRVAAGLGDEQRGRMRECFVQTSKFEYMFWDMAHTKQAFPI